MPWFVACCARSPGLRHPAAVVAWHLSVCLGCGRRRASLACLVAPRGAPRLVQSGRSRCCGRLSQRRGAFPHPGGLRPRLYWVAAGGPQRPAENGAHCACRWPPPRRGPWARSASYPFGAPRWGCPWRVPPASDLGCVHCVGSSRSPPTKKRPFVTRESSAFATLTEVCRGINKHEWSHDSEEAMTHALKIEIPPFDGRSIEKYASNWEDTWCSLAKPKSRIG